MRLKSGYVVLREDRSLDELKIQHIQYVHSVIIVAKVESVKVSAVARRRSKELQAHFEPKIAPYLSGLIELFLLFF